MEEAYAGQVSPRLLPQICAVGIGLLSLVLIAGSIRTSVSVQSLPVVDRWPISWFELRAMLVIGGLLAVAIWLFTMIGPIPASIILVCGILFAMGERRILPFVLIPTVLLVGSYLLFYKLLGTAIV